MKNEYSSSALWIFASLLVSITTAPVENSSFPYPDKQALHSMCHWADKLLDLVHPRRRSSCTGNRLCHPLHIQLSEQPPGVHGQPP